MEQPETSMARRIVRAFRSAQEYSFEEGRTEAYRSELALMECVRTGNETALEQRMQGFTRVPVRIGRMSDNGLRQARYTLVTGITLLTRAAIEGGLSEKEAYRMSDEYLRRADEAEMPDTVIALLVQAMRDFTHRVHVAYTSHIYSYPVTRCIRYIADHLHEHISLSDLASLCGLTAPYLSGIFRRETGLAPMAYIRREKLATAARMLTQSEYPVHQIAGFLAYSTPSLFSADFKRQYGTTPNAYRAAGRGAH